ncbi:YqgQ family protein [Salsuginibacillus kocurii]|uniref:YqgQ family protein n=1 Tax=Salsuginibacillus kocurii TaxID=427078 RepID=UPI00037F1001|nr:YqgQ family protein [Salsuginibacillus kocurii]
METMRDVRELLKTYGTFVYTKDKNVDSDLMELELEELKNYGLLDQETYLKARVIIQKARKEKPLF